MKDPSIHIKESVLLSVMPEVLKCTSPEQAVNLLFERTKKFALVNRTMLKVTTKSKKKVQKIIDNSEANVSQFQTQLINYRKLSNHVRIKQIYAGESEYGLLREIALMADEFVTDFDLPKITGYIEFIRRGITLMGKQYGLGKFKYYKTKIYEQYENSIVIKEDKDKKGTIEFYKIWRNLILEYTGADYELVTDDEKVHMVFGRQEADELEADYYTYLKSQFEGLAFMNIVPELGSLYGLKAKSRYRKYTIDYKKPEEVKLEVSKHTTPEQLRYQELRNKRSKQLDKK